MIRVNITTDAANTRAFLVRVEGQLQHPRDLNDALGRRLVRELQPNVVVDDRLDVPGFGDIKTPEQYQPREGVMVDGKPAVWEAYTGEEQDQWLSTCAHEALAALNKLGVPVEA